MTTDQNTGYRFADGSELTANGHVKWPKCTCGKTLTTSREDAEQKAALAAERYNRHVPNRFYRCAADTWHWAEKYVVVRECECGHRAFFDARAAEKAADYRNRRARHRHHDEPIPVHATAYKCGHDGDHVCLYPDDETLIMCGCGRVAYRDDATAARMAGYLNVMHPNPDNGYVVYHCTTHGTPHIAPKLAVPEPGDE